MSTASRLTSALPRADIFKILPETEYALSVYPNATQTGVVVNLLRIRDQECAATFSATALSGNSSVVVLHGVKIGKEWRGKGIGTRLHALRLQWLKDYHASMALCTVVDGNEPQEKILHRFGWVKVRTAKNAVTGNTFSLYLNPLA